MSLISESARVLANDTIANWHFGELTANASELALSSPPFSAALRKAHHLISIV